MNKKSVFISILTLLFLFSTAVLQGKTIKDRNGKELYSKKKEAHFSKFKRVKQDRIPVYTERKVTSDLIKYLDALEFVELVDGKMGVSFAKIRAYHKIKGYVEGYTKVNFFFKQNYFSEPFEMSEFEVNRLKDVAEKKIMLKNKRDRRKEQRRRERLFNDVILSSRENVKLVLEMNYNNVIDYFKTTNYKLDNEYNINASKTIKFESDESSFYFTFDNNIVKGFKVISNTEGFTESKANVILYESVGEIYYTVDKIDEINSSIIKKYGTMEKSKGKLIVKVDKTKDNPILEITVGEFSGIE